MSNEIPITRQLNFNLILHQCIARPIRSHHHFPEGQSATIDPQTHTVLAQSENAWRYLKWVVRNRQTGAMDIFPDEVFHPQS